MWREATTGKHGDDRKSDHAKEIKSYNVTLDHDRGNRRTYLLARLLPSRTAHAPLVPSRSS